MHTVNPPLDDTLNIYYDLNMDAVVIFNQWDHVLCVKRNMVNI